ncbi:hypothetical protein PHJA_000331300 [Phtheirospermum japonicum]|uniref:Uncharacterized protein n=1 Tax=Phtheirospermum japonicum TaxID=374723 RepID=A0A830B2K3_9LAMI|nr:hypothetical protein PHJA_000331300 [Phtheirospermum japonicum]
MLQSVVKTTAFLVSRPAATLTTLLYYSGLLPRNLNLDRFVHPELIEPDNFIFHFLIHFLRCFW